MGSWSVSCGISNIAITSGNACVLLPVQKARGSETRTWQPATLPIFGKYNDYGGIEEIVKDDNTALIEEHFGVSIDEFATFLVDGKFTYGREEAGVVMGRMKNLKEAEEWQFMWIDRQVYDFMSVHSDLYYKGYMDYGTPEMLELMGFKKVGDSESYNNYDPKRFNQLWRNSDGVEMFSDGRTLLNIKDGKGGSYVYHFGKNDETSIETFFKVPQELDYLKGLAKHEAWRNMPHSKAKEELGYIIGERYTVFDNDELYAQLGIKQAEPKTMHKKYLANLEAFGDRLAKLVNVSINLHPMSGQFAPHVLYLTPQCGEYRRHQSMLEKFVEINKSYIQKNEDE